MNHRRIRTFLLSAVILCLAYGLIRYVLFDFHGMKQWPLTMFLLGAAVVCISCAMGARLIPMIAAVSYPTSFLLGMLLQTDSVDPSGALSNNLWLIWAGTYITMILVAAFIEWAITLKKRKEA